MDRRELLVATGALLGSGRFAGCSALESQFVGEENDSDSTPKKTPDEPSASPDSPDDSSGLFPDSCSGNLEVGVYPTHQRRGPKTTSSPLSQSSKNATAWRQMGTMRRSRRYR